MTGHCDSKLTHQDGHYDPISVPLHSDGICEPLECLDVGSVVFREKWQCNLA